MLSRNFRLQRVGNMDWLEENYGFSTVGYAIDELIVIDVSRHGRNTPQFCEDLKRLTRDCFAPITAGGGIRTLEHVHQLLRSGADKLLINTALHDQSGLVEEIAAELGRQCIVASLDIQKIDGVYQAFTNNGSVKVGESLEHILLMCAGLPIGEIHIASIDRDGTGNGLDLELLKFITHVKDLPLILMGGIGKAEHIIAGLADDRVDAVTTANLLNFMGDGLSRARELAISGGIDLPKF